jgi:predicted ATPase
MHESLVTAFERASAVQPQLVVLRGEAGIGKTRLARKFLAWVSAQEAELLQGGAFESSSHLPFQPLVGAIRLRLEQQITFERMCIISRVSKDLALPALDELISSRLLLEATQPGIAITYHFVNDMLRDVVYTEAGDARRRLFHQRALEVLEAAMESEALLAHHAAAAGLAEATFIHSLVAGREALRISAVNEAIVHFERGRQVVRDRSLPEMSDKADLKDLYTQLGRAYKLGDQRDKASAIKAEREKLD